MFVNRYSRIVIPTEVEGSFLHTGISPYVRQRKRGNFPRKEQEAPECKKDFSTALEMTVWGNSAVCVIAENGNPSTKGARKIGVQGRFLAVLEMTAWGNGSIPRRVQRICLESAILVPSSRPKWRDLSCILVYRPM